MLYDGDDDDIYESSQPSNSPVPEPPPPPMIQTKQQSKINPIIKTTICSNPFTDTTNYQRCFCSYQTPNAHNNCSSLGRHSTKNHFHNNINQNGNYGTGISSYDGRNRLTDEEDSACPALLEREFHSLHRNVPALRRAGVDTTAIRQHYYPDGGWGWIVCSVAFLAHVLTSGLQLSYGLLLLYAMRHLGHEVATEAGWLGAASWSVSMVSTPVVIAFCRRKSTRLAAVLGGLVLALGILFASFAVHLNQVAFSYGVVVGIGTCMVRESSTVMLGHYFKKRRQFVEMITMSGEGVGIALFSVILKEGVGKMGWRLGLQAITGFMSLSFFMGLLYRPASLYHPQRRAIQHLKNQRKKVKEKKTHVRTPKPPFIDFSPFRLSTVRMLLIASSVSAFGIYSPIFFMSLHGFQEGYDVQDLVLLQTFLGLSIALGIVSTGSIINKTCRLGYKDICLSTQYICQISIFITAISILVLSAAFGYRNLCILCWFYGIGLGGFRYTLKILALERIRTKYFTKAWGFIKGAESIPVLIGIPLTSFLNDSSAKYGRSGYYLCSAAAFISSIILFFVGYPSDGRTNLSKNSGNGSITSHCTAITSDCPDLLNRSYSNPGRCTQWYSPFTTMDNGVCGNVNPHLQHHHQHHHNRQNQAVLTNHNNLLNGATGTSSVGARCYGTQCTPGVTGIGCTANNFKNTLISSSIGQSQGKRLQKSLSFVFPPRDNNFCECTLRCGANRCYTRSGTPSHIPTTLPLNQRFQPPRSYSVPEGLANASQVCSCAWKQTPYKYQRYSRPVQVLEQITTSV